MSNNTAKLKGATRVLKSYKGLRKLAKFDGAFADHARELVTEIDTIILSLDNIQREILTNWFIATSTKKRPLADLRKALNISPSEYNKLRLEALEEFANRYRNGALETLTD